MSRESFAELPIARDRVVSGSDHSSARPWQRADISMLGRNLASSRGMSSRARSGFLSESDAAKYLGMSTAELVGLRKLDLAMIEEGLQPHGPPPLWRGGVCSYASESLDEWAFSQSAGYMKKGSSARQDRTSQ